jgi:hypothetical protein
MLPGIPPADRNEPAVPDDGRRPPDERIRMRDVQPLLVSGRQLLRDCPRLTEAEFRRVMLERFRRNDQGLQDDKRNMSSGPADPAGGVFSVLALPWAMFRWLGWRGRLARHRADMDEVIRVLRSEGHFGSA